MYGKQLIEKAVSHAETAIDTVKFKSENIYRSTSDSIDNAVDFTSATFLKAYTNIVGTYHAIKYAGITIAFIAAPVPTLIALSVLWLMELSIDSIKSDIDSQLADVQKRRKFERIVKMLKKYGKVPQTAVVQTKHIRMEIDAVTGTVNGVVLAGTFTGVTLNDIGDSDLSQLASTAPGDDTKSLIEAYICYREKFNGIR